MGTNGFGSGEIKAQRDDLMRVGDVAMHVRCSPHTVRLWARQGRLPAVRLGRRLRFLRADVDAFVIARRS